MNIMDGLNKISAISSGKPSNEEDVLQILETAYIVVEDCREFDAGTLSTARTKGVLSGLSVTGNKKMRRDNTIKVQFNPSSLSFSSGEGNDKKEKGDISQNENGEVRTAVSEDSAPCIQIGIKLVFDRSIYIDSDVQPEVERFLAIIKNAYVHKLAFYWGKMCYRGVIKSIHAEYVLFNQAGIPTRATVNLTMEAM